MLICLCRLWSCRLWHHCTTFSPEVEVSLGPTVGLGSYSSNKARVWACLKRYQSKFHSFTGAYSPGWTFGLPFGVSWSHIQTHGRTPLDEWSARRRDLYLHRTTQHINTTDIHATSGIRTRDPSNQAAADLRLRPRGHWNRHQSKVIAGFFGQLYLHSE
jgi:hypothetical protein